MAGGGPESRINPKRCWVLTSVSGYRGCVGLYEPISAHITDCILKHEQANQVVSTMPTNNTALSLCEGSVKTSEDAV